ECFDCEVDQPSSEWIAAVDIAERIPSSFHPHVDCRPCRAPSCAAWTAISADTKTTAPPPDHARTAREQQGFQADSARHSERDLQSTSKAHTETCRVATARSPQPW